MTTHRAGPAARVRVTADVPVSVTVPDSLGGPGFTVHAEARDRGLEGHVAGTAEPEQVLRLLSARGVLGAVGAGACERVRIRVAAARADDEAVYSADRDLSRRLVLHRRWDPEGPRAVWLGFNPIRGDLQGPPGEVPRRSSLRNVVAIARNALGGLGTLTVLNLFSRRSAAAGDIPAPADEPARWREPLRRVAGSADAVLAAWGAAAGQPHLPRIRDLWAAVGATGHRLAAPAVDGRVRLTTGWPRQPCHPARKATDGVGVAPLPPVWIDEFDAPDAVDCRGRP